MTLYELFNFFSLEPFFLKPRFFLLLASTQQTLLGLLLRVSRCTFGCCFVAMIPSSLPALIMLYSNRGSFKSKGPALQLQGETADLFSIPQILISGPLIVSPSLFSICTQMRTWKGQIVLSVLLNLKRFLIRSLEGSRPVLYAKLLSYWKLQTVQKVKCYIMNYF